jgi:hypothetical protein
VIRVHRGSPADDMGLREGDRITRLNGREIQSSDEFISRIRNMDPGQEVALEVQRDSGERTFRGELESRQQALVLRGRGIRSDRWPEPSREAWQTTYEERGRSSGQIGRSRDIDQQISRIDQQLSRLSRDIEQLRLAVRDLRDQSGRWGRETTARYDEYQAREGARMSERERRDEGRQFDSERGREFGTERGFDTQRDQQPERQFDAERDQQSREFDTGQRPRSRQLEEDRSPGGQIGEERLRPSSGQYDRQ